MNFGCVILAKNRKEAKRIALMESLTAKKSVVEELRRTLEEQRARRDQYDEILSRQSSGTSFNCLPIRSHWTLLNSFRTSFSCLVLLVIVLFYFAS